MPKRSPAEQLDLAVSTLLAHPPRHWVTPSPRAATHQTHGSIMHAEVAIGNSVIELGDPHDEYPERFMTTHLYVPNADDTYASALAAGATPGAP